MGRLKAGNRPGRVGISDGPAFVEAEFASLRITPPRITFVFSSGSRTAHKSGVIIQKY